MQLYSRSRGDDGPPRLLVPSRPSSSTDASVTDPPSVLLRVEEEEEEEEEFFFTESNAIADPVSEEMEGERTGRLKLRNGEGAEDDDGEEEEGVVGAVSRSVARLSRLSPASTPASPDSITAFRGLHTAPLTLPSSPAMVWLGSASCSVPSAAARSNASVDGTRFHT